MQSQFVVYTIFSIGWALLSAAFIWLLEKLFPRLIVVQHEEHPLVPLHEPLSSEMDAASPAPPPSTAISHDARLPA
jgi:hypothetical protein